MIREGQARFNVVVLLFVVLLFVKVREAAGCQHWQVAQWVEDARPEGHGLVHLQMLTKQNTSFLFSATGTMDSCGI